MTVPDPSPFHWFAQGGRARLLRRIRARFGAHLARALDPDDVAQECLLTALRATRGCWVDSRAALTVFLYRVADLRLRHEGRRAGLRQVQTLREEPLRGGPPREPLPGPALLEARARLRRDHRWCLFLREWMTSPWDTSAFVLGRPTTWAARSLHRRARLEMAGRRRPG
jgi:DNA-directed RNA polymerase specialized sigma24 family protein